MLAAFRLERVNVALVGEGEGRVGSDPNAACAIAITRQPSRPKRPSEEIDTQCLEPVAQPGWAVCLERDPFELPAAADRLLPAPVSALSRPDRGEASPPHYLACPTAGTSCNREACKTRRSGRAFSPSRARRQEFERSAARVDAVFRLREMPIIFGRLRLTVFVYFRSACLQFKFCKNRKPATPASVEMP